MTCLRSNNKIKFCYHFPVLKTTLIYFFRDEPMAAEPTDEQIQTLTRFRAELLHQKFIHVPDTWLDQTLQSFNAYAPNSSINCNHLYKKWLNTDLNKIPYKQSPYPHITSQLGQISQIQGPMVMQVVSIRDVSKPEVQQDEDALLDAEKEQDQEDRPTQQTSYQRNKLRHLSFELFDGKEQRRSFEYHPLNGFKEEDCLPGCKVLIKGNMEVSSGVILLKSDNLELLGGKS